MANKGETIRNKYTGEQITWIETSQDNGGKALSMDFYVAPKGLVPVRHIHPNQDEIFEVKSGTLKVEHNGEFKILSKGDIVTIPKGDPHQWWNNSEKEPLEMNIKLKPARNSEVFFEQLFGLVNDNKTKPDGSPKFLQIMAMSNKYEIYVAGPPIAIQKAMGFIIGGIANLLGYKNYYKKYSE